MWELYTGIEQKENTLLLMKEVDGGATVEQAAMGVKCVVIRQNTVFLMKSKLGFWFCVCLCYWNWGAAAEGVNWGTVQMTSGGVCAFFKISYKILTC